MDKIKILYEGLSSNLGGIETFVYNLIKNADKDVFEFYIMLDNEVTMPYQDELEDMGCKIIKVCNRKDSYKQYLSDLKDVYTKNKFDIIHINVMSYSVFERVTYACKYSNSKVIVHSHNGGYTNKLYRTRILHQLGKLMIRKCKFINIACGEKAGKFMFNGQNFEVFTNGIDIDKFKYSEKNRKEIRKELNIKDDEFVIGEIAAFFEVKNHEFLIDFFKDYSDKNPKSKLVLVGVGPRGEIIKEKVRTLGLSEKVLFLGKRTDVNKIYSALDLYIMPSFSEGLSISLCEAQINGLKCYTTDGVDKTSNITGNVDFISLDEGSNKWMEIISKNNNSRDKFVLDKIPDEFDSNKSYKKIYDYYMKIK